MIVKWKLALTLVAACVALTSFGTWRSEAQPTPAGVPADAKKPAEPKPPGAKPVDAVATIFGNVDITRDQFTEHLIRRYGKKELELFVNRQVIATAFARKGLVLRPEEVDAAIAVESKALNLSRAEFEKDMLPRYGRTPEEWAEDVVGPRLMMSRLMGWKLPAVTDAELRTAFGAKYGEKTLCRIISWGKDENEDRERRKVYEKARDDATEFDRQPDHTHFGPVPRALDLDANPVAVAAGKLRVGEISPIIEAQNKFFLIRCYAIMPAEKTKLFDTEKVALLAELTQARIEKEMPKLFAELKREADPKYHLTFPEPAKK